MSEDRYSEAHYARIEIFETNRNHMPWIMVWSLVSFAMVVFPFWPDILVWEPWASTTSILLMVRNEVLVRRHWQYYMEQSKIMATPDSTSRTLIGLANGIGLLFQVTMVAVAVFEYTYYGKAALVNLLVGSFGFVVFAASLVIFIRAASHKPSFS